MGREGSDGRRLAHLLRRSGIRVLLPLSGTEPGDASLHFGSVRWWCVSEKRQQRGAGVVCGLISKGEWVRSVLGHEGVHRSAWIGEEGRWRVSGGQREWLARAGAGGEAAAPILMVNKNLACISSSTFSQTLKTRGRDAATVEFVQG
jgi:hypothetical protein